MGLKPNFTKAQKKAVVAYICRHVASGETVQGTWKAVPWPEDVRRPATMATLWGILHSDEHAAKLREARIKGVEVLVDEEQGIADGKIGPLARGWDGPEGSLGERTQAAKLAMDSRRWRAGKIKPRDYGKDVDGDGDKSVTVEVKLDQSGND